MRRLLTMMVMTSISMMTMAQSTLGSGLNVADFNKSVRPGDDFYEYACGGWMKANPLPAAYSRYGSFDRLQEDNDKRINAILKELQNNTYEKGTIEQKLSDLYKLAMDCQDQPAAARHPVGAGSLWRAGVLLLLLRC